MLDILLYFLSLFSSPSKLESSSTKYATSASSSPSSPLSPSDALPGPKLSPKKSFLRSKDAQRLDKNFKQLFGARMNKGILQMAHMYFFMMKKCVAYLKS